jgi:hypothetical protein
MPQDAVDEEVIVVSNHDQAIAILEKKIKALQWGKVQAGGTVSAHYAGRAGYILAALFLLSAGAYLTFCTSQRENNACEYLYSHTSDRTKSLAIACGIGLSLLLACVLGVGMCLKLVICDNTEFPWYTPRLSQAKETLFNNNVDNLNFADHLTPREQNIIAQAILDIPNSRLAPNAKLVDLLNLLRSLPREEITSSATRYNSIN